MISEEIREEAKRFASFWNSKLEVHPQLKLDGTWPSIGIVDKILFSLRAKQIFNKLDVALIKGAAAYLGIIAYKCWSTYPDTICNLSKVGDNTEDYLLKASGGEFLKDGQEYSILLCNTIEGLLKNHNKELRYFADDTRTFGYENNILSSVAAGIVSGLSSHGQGAWGKLNLKKFEVNLIKCAASMAQSSVDFYANRYAGEIFGGSFDLYFPHLMLPPLKYNEPYLANRSTAACANFIHSNNLTSPQAKMLAKNLSFSPDESISTAGFVISCCLYQEQAPDWLLFVANCRGINNTVLRPSLELARRAYNISDPIHDLEKGDIQSAKNKIIFEHQLGFMPLLYLSDLDKWLEVLPENFFYFLTCSSAPESSEILDNFGILSKLNPDLALQLAFLKLSSGALLEAEKVLDLNFEGTAPENKDLRFRYFEIKSIIASLKQQDYIELIEQAVLTGTNNPVRFASLANQLARHYLQTENFEQALVLCEKINDTCPWWISAQVTRLMGLLAQKKHNEVELILAELSPYLSVSNHLFSFAKAFSLTFNR
jgi:hypothetical protein